MSFEIIKRYKTFDGETLFCQHESQSTKTIMKFSVYLPDKIEKIESAIIWLSGLTCTEENFITKAGAQKYLSHTKTMIICPDTSPRGLGIPGEDDSYDFGSGASFYVNATTENYRDHYQMYDYITIDLIKLLNEDFGLTKYSIMGHSMGGHGALMIGLKEKDLFQSISAFSPIVNPVECAWGKKAFSGYLGSNDKIWKNFDTCELVKSGAKHKHPILIDQGLQDEFYPDQLLTKNLESIAIELGLDLQVHYREGYDHSYYFISSFVESHIQFHLNYLK